MMLRPKDSNPKDPVVQPHEATSRLSHPAEEKSHSGGWFTMQEHEPLCGLGALRFHKATPGTHATKNGTTFHVLVEINFQQPSTKVGHGKIQPCNVNYDFFCAFRGPTWVPRPGPVTTSSNHGL